MSRLNTIVEQWSGKPATIKNANMHTPIRERVLRQLVEALLFEGLVPYTYARHQFHFTIGEERYTAAGYISGFGRIRLQAATIKRQEQSHLVAANILHIVDALDTEKVVKDRLKEQLNQTILLCEWNTKQLQKPKSRRELSYGELESAIDEGHPYHPCFKARTGFSEEDHQRYGPEGGETFQLVWLGVKRDLIQQNIPGQSDEAFWQQEIGAPTLTTLIALLSAQGGSWLDFGLLPMHPWQWKVLQADLAQAINSGDLIFLGEAGDRYQATLSVRTLINVDRPDKANIKLPLSMVNTSSLRIFETHSVCSAPVISQWLESLVDSDPYYTTTKTLSLLSEYAGITLNNRDKQNHRAWVSDLDGQLGVIFRESIEVKSRAAEAFQSVPFVSLALIEEDGDPFIDTWIQQHGCEPWLTQLLDVVVTPVWHLLVHHGIALEAHAQNMILQLDKGWPEKIILRDFHESMEYVHDFIANPALIPEFASLDSCYSSAKPNQYYWMESVEALRELFVDTLFVFNLADLAILLEERYQFSETKFWSLVKQCFLKYEADDITDPERIAKLGLYQPKVATESLITKKLQKSYAAEFHHIVPNPLNVCAVPTQNSGEID